MNGPNENAVRIGFGISDQDEIHPLWDFVMGVINNQPEFQTGVIIDRSLSVAQLNHLILGESAGSAVGGWLSFNIRILIILDPTTDPLERKVLAVNVVVLPVVDLRQSANKLVDMVLVNGIDPAQWCELTHMVHPTIRR